MRAISEKRSQVPRPVIQNYSNRIGEAAPESAAELHTGFCVLEYQTPILHCLLQMLPLFLLSWASWFGGGAPDDAIPEVRILKLPEINK